jgi:hypothetical protein
MDVLIRGENMLTDLDNDRSKLLDVAYRIPYETFLARVVGNMRPQYLME